MLISLLFIATTTLSKIQTAIAWTLMPVPFVPEKRAAVMIGLTVRFVPVILHQAAETAQALCQQ